MLGSGPGVRWGSGPVLPAVPGRRSGAVRGSVERRRRPSGPGGGDFHGPFYHFFPLITTASREPGGPRSFRALRTGDLEPGSEVVSEAAAGLGGGRSGRSLATLRRAAGGARVGAGAGAGGSRRRSGRRVSVGPVAALPSGLWDLLTTAGSPARPRRSPGDGATRRGPRALPLPGRPAPGARRSRDRWTRRPPGRTWTAWSSTSNGVSGRRSEGRGSGSRRSPRPCSSPFAGSARAAGAGSAGPGRRVGGSRRSGPRFPPHGLAWSGRRYEGRSRRARDPRGTSPGGGGGGG